MDNDLSDKNNNKNSKTAKLTNIQTKAKIIKIE